MKCGLICARNARTSARASRSRELSSSARSSCAATQRPVSLAAWTRPGAGGPSDSAASAPASDRGTTTAPRITQSRTLHALQQARKTGFNHFTACFRNGTWGEHPLGRACDFAAAPGGFGGVATGADRDYGNRLAGWFIANADRLGVLYVIWYHQIWNPVVGWHYFSGDGTPSGDHMNHFHLSER
jgi:hypothetical protein